MSETRLFDRRFVRQSRRRAVGGHFLLEHVCADIVERVAQVNRTFPAMLEMSPRPGALAYDLVKTGEAGAAVVAATGRPTSPPALPTTVVDEEWLPFAPGSFDLVASLLTLHSVNDVPGALVQIIHALRPDGLFIAALFGGETLRELREALTVAEAEVTGGASPRVIPFTEMREAGRLLQRAGFALPVADIERLTVRYADPLALMRDIRAMGEANPLAARARRPLPRAVLARALAIYGERFADPDGRMRATFDIVTMTGWRPDPSQQRPLQPGSARTRLADALRTTEVSAGEGARPSRRRPRESGGAS